MNHAQYALTVLLAVAPVNVYARTDALCVAITQFANASGDGADHSVVLMNLWGTPEVADAVTQACSHETGDAPGARLCSYLTANTAWEFQALNAWHVLRCLGVRHAAQPTQMDGAPMDAGDARDPPHSFQAERVRGVSPSIRVILDWGRGGAAEVSRHPWLRITVRRHSP